MKTKSMKDPLKMRSLHLDLFAAMSHSDLATGVLLTGNRSVVADVLYARVQDNVVCC